MTTMGDLAQQNALIGFSFNTLTQANALRRVRQRLSELSQNWPEEIQDVDLYEYYDLFWLLVLGAYEVLRTMDQHANCFSAEKQTEIKELKKRLAKIRIPFAKQELRGRGGPIENENSFTDISNGLSFEIEGQQIESAELLDEVVAFLDSFASKDIHSPIPTR
ncbi:hypothetical protein [Ruegeria arenilitoris]|uniref:hypothetical protein n=1 Tax=Ruegeria arenilitoris TaxID=1173585 RepID=UPI00147B259E|nr:hypothetical protein [Ruegeria arenilitoris]